MVSLTGMTPVSNAYVGLASGGPRFRRGVYFPPTADEGGCAVCSHLCEYINHCTFSFSLLYSGSRRIEMFLIGSLTKKFENHCTKASPHHDRFRVLHRANCVGRVESADLPWQNDLGCI